MAEDKAQIQDEDSLVEYGFRRVIITITAVLCALLEIIDTTIVNVALNDMRGSLGATLTDIAWVITAYAIANVIIIPMTSWLSKQFGRRNYFAKHILRQHLLKKLVLRPKRGSTLITNEKQSPEPSIVLAKLRPPTYHPKNIRPP